MENQAAKKIVQGRGGEGIDRISELPQPILHHILCFLSQRQAIQTCTLSKSWRHVGSTRPKIAFHVFEDYRYVKGNQDSLVSAIDRTLQTYHDRRLSVQELDLRMPVVDQPNAVPILEKWIPVVMMGMRVEIFHLVFFWEEKMFFDVPSVLFEAESLKKLYLKRCRLNQQYPIGKVLCKHLQTLHLSNVFVTDQTIETVLSNCPLIENVSLLNCFGLKTVRVIDKLRAPKHIEVHDDWENTYNPISVEIDLPTISTVTINRCWIPHHSVCLPHLTRLLLTEVRLSCKSFDFFSCYFPCIQVMQLFNCTGFKELNLFSHSIKRLSIVNTDGGSLCRATIYAPSIVSFNYIGPILQPFSFETTSCEWKSDIDLRAFYADSDTGASGWFDNLNGLLTELMQSKIYLTVMEPKKIKRINIDGVFQSTPNPEVARKKIKRLNIDGVFHNKPNPVVVECLKLKPTRSLCKYFSIFLIGLFRICRPRYIGQYAFFRDAQADLYDCRRKHNKVLEFICEILLKKGDTRKHNSFCRQCGLEEVSMEAFDMNINEWRRVQSTSSLEAAATEIRFQLKWRELRSDAE